MVSHNSFLTYVVLYDKTETRIYGVYVVLCKCYAGKVLNNLLSYPNDVLNIAKGTTDPRVEFISQDHSSQFTNLDYNFRIWIKH